MRRLGRAAHRHYWSQPRLRENHIADLEEVYAGSIRSVIIRPATGGWPRCSGTREQDACSASDRIGLVLLGCLLCSPLLFKIRLTDSIVLHLFVPHVLLAAWGWVAWESRHVVLAAKLGMSPRWRAWNVPILLLGLSVAGLVLRSGREFNLAPLLQRTGLLLLVKWVLYLAPLPLASLADLRRPVLVSSGS